MGRNPEHYLFTRNTYSLEITLFWAGAGQWVMQSNVTSILTYHTTNLPLGQGKGLTREWLGWSKIYFWEYYKCLMLLRFVFLQLSEVQRFLHPCLSPAVFCYLTLIRVELDLCIVSHFREGKLWCFMSWEMLTPETNVQLQQQKIHKNIHRITKVGKDL